MPKRFYALNRVPQAVGEWNGDSAQLNCVPSIRVFIRPKHLVALTDKGSVGAEKFRVLAVRLRSFQRRQQLKKLLVTSSVKGEGKSVMSANLAVTLANQGQRTLLVDGDLRQSGLAEILGSYDQPGLSDWWRQTNHIVDFLRRVDGLSMWYLSAGKTATSPVEIFQSQRFSEMLSETAKWFDWVIIDSPPLVPVADSSLFASQTDGALLVVRQGKTPKPLLQEALKTDSLKLLGIVANEWSDSDHRYYGQYYGNYAVQHQELAPAAVEASNHPSLPPGVTAGV